MSYIYWPKHLSLGRYGSKATVSSAVVGLCEKETDLMVLALVSESLYKELRKPYLKIGTVNSSGDFHCEMEGYYDIIEFTPPKLKLMQFFSLEPISLTLPEKRTDEVSSQGEPNVTQICQHNGSSPNKTLRRSLNLINLYYKHLHRLYRQYPQYNSQNSRILSKVWSYLQSFLKSYQLYSLICHITMYFIMVVRVCAGMVSSIVNSQALPLVNISATAQQIDLRCQQMCYFPVQYLRINNKVSFDTTKPRLKSNETPESGVSEGSSTSMRTLPCEYYPDYIRLYNTLWLIANDISFGITLGTILFESSAKLSVSLHYVLELVLYTSLRKVTLFLDNSPFGIKLNGALAKFLSELFLWIIDFSYVAYIKHIIRQQTLEQFIKIMASFCSVLGATFALSLAVDFLSLLSMHISLFYFISAKIYHWKLSVMHTLFYLFCGKKRNVLRNRVDSNMFQLDQLLMGTLLFTVLVFLLPTVFAFYFTYTLLRMCIVTVEVSLESTMALLNHFPLFVLLLRLKDPKRLPGGISLSVVNSSDNRPKYVLKNNPLGVAMMFEPYSALMGIMAENYFSLRTVKQILAGLPIVVHRNKLYQVFYSSLPAKPIGVQMLWNELKRAMK